MIRLIVALDEKRGMADDQGIPWQGKLPSDAQYFRRQTEDGAIVMGFRTYQEFAQPLHDRTNYVVARPGGPPLRPGFEPVDGVESFVDAHADEVVWVIGGAALYAQSMPLADQLYITQLDGDFHCTKFFPAYADDFVSQPGPDAQTENGITFSFEIWERNRPE